MYVIGYPLQALAQIISTLLFLYTIIIIASAVISWLRLDPWHPAVRVLNMLTTPVYKRLRPWVPRTGHIDLVPLVLLLLIMFVQQGILPIVSRFAANLVGGDL